MQCDLIDLAQAYLASASELPEERVQLHRGVSITTQNELKIAKWSFTNGFNFAMRRCRLAITQKNARIADLENVLKEKFYYNEFVVIDGLNQHKDGLNFEQWLTKSALSGQVRERGRSDLC
jgi:hypothetical protein